MRRALSHGLLAVCAVLMVACTGAKVNSEPQASFIGESEMPYAPAREPEVGDILHMPTGLYVEQEQMLRAVTDHQIVYVGETHDNPASHRLQLQVLQAMAKRYPGQVALGMEMFTPKQQAALDRWVAGELDEASFLREATWFETWGGDFGLYREIMEFCRDNDISVVGLNADKSLIRAISQNEPGELSEAIQQQLPNMGFIDEYQQAMVEAIFSAHGPVGPHTEGFKRVQTLWDQAMAENAAQFLGSEQGKGRRMVVIAGGQHVQYGYGIPRRLFRILPVSYCIVGAEEIVVPEEKKDQMMDVDMPRFPMPAYDYALYCEYEIFEGGVALGVLFGDLENKLIVEKVVDDSNAQRAGMQVGDQLRTIDGRSVQDLYDIKHQLSQNQSGDRARLVVEREGELIELELAFQ